MERVSIFISCDEAPAAYHVAQRETDCDRAEMRFPKRGPTSLVAAEVHLGRTPAGIHGSWLHCNIQVVCQRSALINVFRINVLDNNSTGPNLCFRSIRTHRA